jgi:hypothetical protein
VAKNNQHKNKKLNIIVQAHPTNKEMYIGQTDVLIFPVAATCSSNQQRSDCHCFEQS